MKTSSEIRALLSQSKSELVRKYGIKQLGIFGSYGRGDHGPSSDIDILVEFSEPIGIEFVDLANELERILDGKVDLVSKDGIKPRYWKLVASEVIYV